MSEFCSDTGGKLEFHPPRDPTGVFYIRCCPNVITTFSDGGDNTQIESSSISPTIVNLFYN